MQDSLRQLIADSIAAPIPRFTRRDIRLPAIPGKAVAVIGMRGSGKTTFMWQCLADRLATGAPRDALPFLNLEDERLAGIQATDLHWLVEEYFRQRPGLRGSGSVGFYFDEIQVVPGWETFARRLIDTEGVDLLLSGSSARLLSREVATSMRGRSMEALVHPFSYREVLRHTEEEPDESWERLDKNRRSLLDSRLREYLWAGGFPEAQGARHRDRVDLLRNYVDVAVLRDVIERYHVNNTVALRWLQRQLLASPAAPFSAHKFHAALRSQGIPVGKDAVHAFIGYLEDTFLIRTISLYASSERQRMANPRKAYPVDPGLIAAYDRTGKLNLGAALETCVLVELERRRRDCSYVRTKQGYEVDFIARDAAGRWELIQVCADILDASTREREFRALVAASEEHSEAEPLLLTLDSVPPPGPLPDGVRWMPAAEWLLAEVSD